MATRADIIDHAFRRLGIKAEDEALTADQERYAGDVLDALYDEVSAEAPVSWWPNDVPKEAVIPFANLLAVEIGPSYSVAVESRAKPYGRLLAVLRKDDRSEEPSAMAEYF